MNLKKKKSNYHEHNEKQDKDWKISSHLKEISGF